MRVEVTPRRLSAVPGKPVVITVQVSNTGSVISGHRLRVLGVDPEWASFDQDSLSLFPDASGVAVLTVNLPPGIPAGTRKLDIEVTELTPPNDVSVVPVDLAVPADLHLDLSVEPVSSTGGKSTAIAVMVTNTGNSVVDVDLAGKDDEGELEFEFTPPAPTLAPGEQVLGSARIRAPRPWFGSPKIRAYTVEAGPPQAPVIAYGAWVQKPRFTRGQLALFGLVAAATVFAVVISVALSQVVSKSNADRDLALQVAAASQTHGIGGSSGIRGTVSLLTTGAPVSGVTVDVYPASNVTSPEVSTATAANGSYSFSGLAAGSYKLQFDGAGFTELWYPESLSPTSATAVNLAAGKTTAGIDIHLGGLPATVSGQVVGGDPTGALLTLELPVTGPSGVTTTPSGASTAAAVAGAAPVVLTSATRPDGRRSTASVTSTPSLTAATSGADVPTIVTSETLDATGDFVLTDIPSPAVYDLVVTKQGYATTTQEIDLGGGEVRKNIVIELHLGDGSIAGTVSSSTGTPLGAATVSASTSSTTVNTISETTAGHVGQFILSSLPTPDTLTLVVSDGGYASQTLTVSLAADQQLTGIAVVLSPGVGSISGTVTTPPGSPVGDVTVTATNGSQTLTTATLSTGRVGTYKFSGLQVPSTYTLTFSRPDLASQTRAISLQASGPLDITGVDATMVAQTATISGVVSQVGGGGLGDVSVALTSGTVTYQVTSASAPTAGSYEVEGVEPGTYTLSFTRQGGVPTSIIVTLTAGRDLVQNEQLSAAAEIYGFVDLAGSTNDQPLPGATVTLYLASQYPTVITDTATTDKAGEFTFANVDAPQGYIVAVSFDGGSPQETVPITTSPGKMTEACGSAATGGDGSTSPNTPSGTCSPLEVST